MIFDFVSWNILKTKNSIIESDAKQPSAYKQSRRLRTPRYNGVVDKLKEW